MTPAEAVVDADTPEALAAILDEVQAIRQALNPRA